MSGITPTAFAHHVESTCGSLVREAAQALGCALEILDEAGRVVLSAGSGDERVDRWAFAANIESNGDIIGILRCSSASEAHRAFFATLAHDTGTRVAAAVDMDCMIERLAVCYDELDLLYRMSAVLRPEKRLSETCSGLLQETAPHMQGATLFIYLEGDDHLEFRSKGTEGLSDDFAPLPVAKSQYRQLVANVESERGDSLDSGGLSRRRGSVNVDGREVPYVGFSIHERTRVAGFVGLHHIDATEPPETGELKILECLALQLTDVITRTALLDELRDMLFNTVKTLVAAVDAKDAYTRGHSERVYQLAVRIGEELGLPPEQLQNLAWAALLHDIGKIAIPEQILRKTEALTSDEFRMIQTHPVRGETMLGPITQLAGILPGIRNHHERLDGRGYPDRLSGEKIPLIARIISVADTFDALVSTRAYRRARTREYAIREIERSAGTQLDPEIVNVFLRLVRSEDPAIPGRDELRDAA